MDANEKRAKWREWQRKRRERMTPEELAEEKARQYAAKVARYSTPEGREKRREMERRWRQENPDRVKINRERDKAKRRQKTAEARAARLADPEYIKVQAEKRVRAREKLQRDYKADYAERRARLNADPEALAAFQAKQREYRRTKHERLLADPAKRAAYLERLKRRQKPKVELTEKEKEDRAPRTGAQARSVRCVVKVVRVLGGGMLLRWIYAIIAILTAMMWAGILLPANNGGVW